MPPDASSHDEALLWFEYAIADMAVATMPLPERSKYEMLLFHAQQADELYEEINRLAKKEGLSLNDLVIALMARAVEDSEVNKQRHLAERNPFGSDNITLKQAARPTVPHRPSSP